MATTRMWPAVLAVGTYVICASPNGPVSGVVSKRDEWAGRRPGQDRVTYTIAIAGGTPVAVPARHVRPIDHRDPAQLEEWLNG